MTLEEALARIAELEASATTSTAHATKASKEIQTLKDESAARRVKNTELAKRDYVAKQILKKNNITADIDKINMDNISISSETGEITGDVSYNPASSVGVGAGSPATDPGTSGAMTLESIQGMNRADIAKNWDAVSKVLAEQETI